MGMTSFSHHLKNGLTILSTPITGNKTISGQLFLSAGSRYETTAQQELFHLAEHAVAATLEQKLRQHGLPVVATSIDAGCFDRRTVFTFTCTPPELVAVLGILAEVLSTPRLMAQQVETERGYLLRELVNDKNMLTVRFAKLWRANVFAGTALAHSQFGTTTSIRQLSVAAVATAIKKYYVPTKACLSLAGKISPMLVKTASIPVRLWRQQSRQAIDPITSTVTLLTNRPGTTKRHVGHITPTRIDYTVILPIKTIRQNITAELALQAVRRRLFPALRRQFSGILLTADFITYPGMLVTSIEATLSARHIQTYQRLLPELLRNCGQYLDATALTQWKNRYAVELNRAYHHAPLAAQIQGFYFTTFGRVISHVAERRLVAGITSRSINIFLRQLATARNVYWTILE